MTAFLDPPFGGFQPVTHAFYKNPSTKNYNPRVGLAYDPFNDHKTSIRAGFGLFHDLLLPRLYDPGYWLNPPYAIGVQLQPNYPTPFAGNGILPPQASQVEGMNYYLDNTPYVVQYNFNIQRELGAGNILTVGYVGSEGVHLIQSVDENPPTIVSGTIYNPVFDAELTSSGSVQIPNGGRENPNPLVGALSEKNCHRPLSLQLAPGQPSIAASATVFRRRLRILTRNRSITDPPPMAWKGRNRTSRIHTTPRTMSARRYSITRAVFGPASFTRFRPPTIFC